MANKPDNRTKWPFIVVYSHFPLYCTMVNSHTNYCARVRENINDLEKLFELYKVNLYIAGHLQGKNKK